MFEKKFTKNEDFTSIIRCEHDEENPYTQVSNALIRDENISPNCRWLLIYLLSNVGKWKINVKQVYEHAKKFMGRDAVYALFDEAIEAGYMERRECSVNNLKRYFYVISERPKFKKCFRHPEFQETGDQGSKERTSQEYHHHHHHTSSSSSNEDPPDQGSLRSDDDDSFKQKKDDRETYKILDEAPLTKNEKVHISKKYTEKQVISAINRMRNKKIDTNYAGYLLRVLENMGEDPPDIEDVGLTEAERLSYQYNSILAKICPKMAERNKKNIKEGKKLEVLLGKIKSSLSFESPEFIEDLKELIRVS